MRRTLTHLVGLIAVVLAAALPVPAAADTAPAPPTAGLDARAAAGSGTAPDSPGTRATWHSGTLAPGATQDWQWNNVGALTAHHVGLDPTGALGTQSPCLFEVTGSRYVQRVGGERQFHFTIRNTGTISCGTNVLLAVLGGMVIGQTGTVSPGGSQEWVWNNANPELAYLAGLGPSGAAGADCRFELSRGWYAQASPTELEFHVVVRNIGTIACAADLRLAWHAYDQDLSGLPVANLPIGWTLTWQVHLTRPGTAPLVGLSKLGNGGCELEVIRSWFEQRRTFDGINRRFFLFTVRNAGAVNCPVHPIARLAPLPA